MRRTTTTTTTTTTTATTATALVAERQVVREGAVLGGIKRGATARKALPSVRLVLKVGDHPVTYSNNINTPYQ